MAITDRLYYTADAPRTFQATVRRVARRDNGIAVWLDRTGFYPTSGGQPHDLGALAGIPVIDVVDDDGEVMHVLAGEGLVEGQLVDGTIDWPRRLDHRQQHTGQHVLSAVLERLCGARTLSFHLGTGSSTIDLDRELSATQLASAEQAANAAVWDDRLVSIRYVSDVEARALPLRKEPARAGTLRLIEIEGVDLSACGGTHVERTGAIGQIAMGSAERFKGGQRLEFRCGGRALERHQQLRDVVAASIRLLSVLPGELPAAIERVQRELKEQARSAAALQRDLARHEAAALAAAAQAVAGGRIVLEAVNGDAATLKALALAAIAAPGLVVVLVSRSTPASAVAARSADVDLSCHDIVTALASAHGGRGGGRPELAQCGGLGGEPESILASARMLLTTRLSG